MNQLSSPAIHTSGSNPSLLTAGLPSSSIMIPQRIPPASTINHNQNRAMDIHSPPDDRSQHTALSNRTLSDTYLNLSRNDIDDVMIALHTLARHVHSDAGKRNQQEAIPSDDNASHQLPMLFPKDTIDTFKSSTQANGSSQYHSRYSIRKKRRHSLSSDRWLHHQDHVKQHLDLVEKFRHDLYEMQCKQKRRMLRRWHCEQTPTTYPSYSSNAIVYAMPCKSNRRPRQIHHRFRQHQSTVGTLSQEQYLPSIKLNPASSMPLSSYIVDQLIALNPNEPILRNVQMLPLSAHTLQILHRSPMHSFISIDSLNTKDISGTGDQLTSQYIDVATQWSLQGLTPSTHGEKRVEDDHPEALNLHVTRTDSNILTDLTQSTATVPMNDSTSKTEAFLHRSPPWNDAFNNQYYTGTNATYSEKSSSMTHNEHELTRSMTERFLTTLKLPTCQCSTAERHGKQALPEDNVMCISLGNHSALGTPSNVKRTTPLSIPSSAKRSRRHRPKAHRKMKQSRLPRRARSTDRLPVIIQSPQTTNPNDDTSFDFFDIETTFSDAYDRLFADTTASEKSSWR